MSAPTYRARLEDQPLDFSVSEERRVFDGFRPLDVLTLTHAPLAEARRGRVRREIVRGGRCAVVIPYDPARDAIVVIRQFRVGAALATPHAAPLELPAGGIDEGEDPAAGAARELEEETGLRPRAVAHCFSVLSTPGLTDELAMVFLAIVDTAHLTGRGGKADEDEDILAIPAPFDALLDAVDRGAVQNGFLVCATHWFARHGRAHAALLADSIQTDPVS
ncbi:NUDIX hydrolase [Aureimonas flava]|uniref:GDP-mannose pyrophosphatase n=1 Tax=Aureimonas flava TaxID=2320271 RepID=A0A3A1WT92_9HYPH|nr:NUDIX hydrolase [Aureimonas flava]RIY00965.1 NUDIX hydrolase [Aureimonas flava]